MTSKQEPEHTTKDVECLDGVGDDEAAIALKKIATQDMAPISDEENRKILKKIDLWLMPIVCSLVGLN